jgi:hypothetical protein
MKKRFVKNLLRGAYVLTAGLVSDLLKDRYTGAINRWLDDHARGPTLALASWIVNRPFVLTVIGLTVFVVVLAVHALVVSRAETSPDSGGPIKPEKEVPLVSVLKPNAESGPEPTLQSLMLTSFPKLSSKLLDAEVRFANSSVPIKCALYFDLTMTATFLGVYLPSSPHSLNAAVSLASQATSLSADIAGTGLQLIKRDEGKPEPLSQFVFTRKVYLFHEDYLPHQQLGQIETAFEGHNLQVVFRGPEFLRQAWLEWKQRAERVAASEVMPQHNADRPPALPVFAPTNRPRLVFDRWGPNAADHPLHSGRSYIGQVARNGFHFINDGGPAYEVMVEKFMVGQSEAHSASVPRIGTEGFVLVWLDQPLHLQSPQSPGKWDLPAYMSLAAVHAHPSSVVYGQDYTVTVRATYRDGNDADSRLWYRSSATLAYIPSQHRLEFRDITHERGSLTRPS